MRKVILLSLICLFSMQSVFSQKNQEIKLGLKFAPNLSFLYPTTQDYNYEGVKFKGSLGLVSDFYFAEHYAFSTGLNFLFLGGKITYPDTAINNKAILYGSTVSTMSFVYIEIPIMLKMFTKKFGRFDFFGQVGFGTGFRIASSAKTQFTANSGYTKSEKSDNMNRTTVIRESVIIGLGTEYSLDQSTRLFFGLGYTNSLNNVLKGYNPVSGLNQKAYLNYVELNLGVMF